MGTKAVPTIGLVWVSEAWADEVQVSEVWVDGGWVDEVTRTTAFSPVRVGRSLL